MDAGGGSSPFVDANQALDDLLESSLIGVAYVSDGVVRYVNRSMLLMLGVDTSKLVGKPIAEVIESVHREDRERLLSLQREVSEQASRQEAHTEFRWCRPDGQTRWLKLQGVGTTFDGRPALRGVVVDVTEQHEALERLRASEERYRRMVELLPSGILVHSDEKVVLANRAAVRLFGGQTEADIVGQRILDHIVPEHHPVVRQRVARVYRGNEEVPVIEVMFRKLTGEPFWVEASASSVEHEGRPASMVVFRDISERKKAETEKVQLEAQLLQSQKLEAVGRLAGGVAHDFNNLLTEISGQSELALLDLSSDHPHHPMLRAVCDAAQRATSLTRQLLAFSRKQVMLPRGMHINEIVLGLEKMLSRLIGEDIQFQVAPASFAGQVVVDPGQIEQVVLNLCVNARDAMPNGGRLLVTTGVEMVDTRLAERLLLPRTGPYAVVSVIDTGCGMVPEVMSRLFEPFFTTKSKEQGTGLGLSTSYGIVRQHLGAIDVRSESGKGSVFKVFLPLADTVERQAGVPAEEEELSGGAEVVLCVEDEPLVREVTVTMLRRLGYVVLEAESPDAALALAQGAAGRVDLLVTDVIMPGMNGRELAEALLRLRPGLRILYTSGYTEDVIAQQGLLSPDVHFLGKPFSLRRLALAIRGALDDSPARRTD